MRHFSQPYHEVKLYIGSREGYEGPLIPYDRLLSEVSEYQKNCDRELVCPVRITETRFVFEDYQETGFEITVINYPRFPRSKLLLNKFIYDLAGVLLERLKQNRISIVFPDEIVMVESDEPNDQRSGGCLQSKN